MKQGQSSTLEELQMISRFESLRKILRSEEYAEHREKPLGYWALPADCRLPLAFLGRKVQELLNTSFSELALTPGIGRKKMASLVMLLARAANTDPSQLPTEVNIPQDILCTSDGRKQKAAPDGFDPSVVSEVVWAQWRETIAKHDLGNETLGRLAPSLRDMTRVIWNSPLSAYTDRTLDDLRRMKTHGAKRIRAVLEVFYSVHAVVANIDRQEHLTLRLVPRLIDQVECWVGQALQTPGIPNMEELRKQFIEPLLEQVRIDTTQQIVVLAENRLGITGPITSVRQVARSMGLTRARVYQLLNEINDILAVRWPMGRHQVHELRNQLQAEAAQMQEPPDLQQFLTAIEVFYPSARRGAEGRLDKAAAEPKEQRAVAVAR